jgi:hypothetical protein
VNHESHFTVRSRHISFARLRHGGVGAGGGTKIDRVDIKFIGPASVSEDSSAPTSSSRRATLTFPAARQDDVHSLYATGQFYNIRVSVDQADDGGVI